MKKPNLILRGKTIHIREKVQNNLIRFSLGIKLIDSLSFENGDIIYNGNDIAILNYVKSANEKINKLYEIWNELYIKFISKEITAYQFNKTLIARFKNKENSNTVIVSKLIEYYISGIETGTVLSSRQKKYDKNSVRAMKTSLNLIQKFTKGMSINDIDNKTHLHFIQYLNSKDKTNTNTVRKHVKVLKTLGKWLFENDYLQTNFSLNWKKPPEPESTHVYLTTSELFDIQKATIQGSLEHFRILFMIQCYTGLRVSDLLKLKQHHVINNRIIITQKKTETPVVIPTHDKLNFWLERWFNHPKLGKVFEQDYNENIKFICQNAGIKNDVQITINTVNGEIEKTVPKYSIITSHTARRTAITQLWLNNCPKNVIMTISGHRSESSLLKYIKASGIETVENVDLNKYF